jgi:hypothetical protein
MNGLGIYKFMVLDKYSTVILPYIWSFDRLISAKNERYVTDGVIYADNICFDNDVTQIIDFGGY